MGNIPVCGRPPTTKPPKPNQNASQQQTSPVSSVQKPHGGEKQNIKSPNPKVNENPYIKYLEKCLTEQERLNAQAESEKLKKLKSKPKPSIQSNEPQSENSDKNFSSEAEEAREPKKNSPLKVEVPATPKKKIPPLKPGEEIVIKCELETMVKLFFKDYVIVWHDPNVDSEENKSHKAQLERFCKVQTFTEWKKASKYIKEAKAICHVLTSGTNGELLVKEIFESPSVLEIYIFCANKEYHSTWAQNYSKVSCIEIDIEKVLNQIEENLLKWYKDSTSLRINLPAFAPIFNNWDKSKINRLHHYLKVLPNFKNRSQAKNDLINLSKVIFPDEMNTAIIKDFEKDYNEYRKEEILRWYTHESFLYKITNNCLRIASADSIQYCRLLLKDLEQAIKEQYQVKSKHFSGVLYRGAYLSQEEWKNLKDNLGQDVEMHGFLSSSKDPNVALSFMEKDSSQKVFITILVPKGPTEEEQGFAEVEEFSKYWAEREILFNVRSRFTVLEAEDASSGDLPYRHLVLLYGAQGFRKYITENNPVQEISIPNIKDLSCSICQEKFKKMMFTPINTDNTMGDIYLCVECLPSSLHANQVSFLCIPESSANYKTKMKGLVMNYPIELDQPFYGYKCCQCQAKKQQFYFKCTECSERKEVRCNNCFDGFSGCAENGHAIVLESNPFQFWCEKMSANELNHLRYQSKVAVNNDIFQQAEMFSKCHQYQKSIQYYSLYLQQNETNGDKSQLATCYNNLGTVYESQGVFKEALGYLLKALEMRKSLYGEDHADVATSFCNLGSVYSSQGEYGKAAEYHVQALKIRKGVCGINHHDYASSLNNVALVAFHQGAYKEALKFHVKAVVKRKKIYGVNHPEVAASCNNVGLVSTCLGDYTKAFEYHSKALEIQKLVYGEYHPDIATSLNNIGNANMSQGEYSKALEVYLKALKIFEAVYKENHLSIAGSSHNVGLAYTSLGEHDIALGYHSKALKMRKETLHEKHPAVAISYSNIGCAFYSQGKQKEALACLKKARGMRREVYGENHALTMSTSKQIEDIQNNREIQNNQYFMKNL